MSYVCKNHSFATSYSKQCALYLSSIYPKYFLMPSSVPFECIFVQSHFVDIFNCKDVNRNRNSLTDRVVCVCVYVGIS